MLLRFSVANLLSIAGQQELSLVASKLKGPEAGLLDVPSEAGLKGLPAAVIYGANASGKTNFLKAFRFMETCILYSHSSLDPQGGVPRIPFALDERIKASPTRLEVDFILDNVRYAYGFECDNDRFVSEWLYSFPEGKRRKLFERKDNDVDFGSFMRGAKKALVEFMRPNSLFLSTATQNDHEELSKITSFFRGMKYIGSMSFSADAINESFKGNKIDSRTMKLLAEIGTGIVDQRVRNREKNIDIKNFTEKVTQLFKEQYKLLPSEIRFETREASDAVIELAHRGGDADPHYFGLERESAGTRRLLKIMSSVFAALDEGTMVFIDELDASLHTLAAEKIIELFLCREINKKGAQLITTTHDTNILNCKSLRRDQIWFCEKDGVGASHIFSLSEIKSRPSDNFEQGYLEGRYGAIPFAGNLRALFAGE